MVGDVPSCMHRSLCDAGGNYRTFLAAYGSGYGASRAPNHLRADGPAKGIARVPSPTLTEAPLGDHVITMTQAQGDEETIYSARLGRLKLWGEPAVGAARSCVKLFKMVPFANGALAFWFTRCKK